MNGLRQTDQDEELLKKTAEKEVEQQLKMHQSKKLLVTKPNIRSSFNLH
ncbi:uncharacterized protein METZ01_LOCUS450299 [marine metagenome]|uniref:Uncharacterized protein n=1 Tax=marine metagenome TaxID=408172 RepID=A0A382ZQW3_9ZZZZ